MKQTNKNTKGGWYENTDPGCLNDKGKPVARKHYEVAIKDRLKETLRTPLAIFKPDKETENLENEAVTTFSFKELSDKQREALEEQIGEDSTGLVDFVTDGEGRHAIVQKSKVDDFLEFLKRTGIDVPEDYSGVDKC